MKSLVPSLILAASLAVTVGRSSHGAPAAAPSSNVTSATARARDLASAGQVTEAIKILEGVTGAPANADGTPELRRARLLLGELRIEMGRRRDAEAPLLAIIRDYNDDHIGDGDAEGLAVAGRAAHLLRSPKDANTLFNKSERADKKRVETLLWRGELFLEKYDPGHAEEVLREALALEPKNADALVAMARVKLEQALDFDGAEHLLTEALATNGKHAGALAVRAAIALHDLDIAGAEGHIAQGLAGSPRNLELLTLKAAARFLADDRPGYERARSDVFAKNPEYSRFYGIVGDLAEWEHRYDDIVTMMREATKVDPDDARAWADLGLTQLRAGDEAAGLQALRTAWSKDKFNVRVFNTLNLYEKTLPASYEDTVTPVFKIRYPKDEKAVLERYLPTLVAQAWGSMKARYGFVPKTPVQVELYGSREQFSVRTSGLPNIGIQGVCFGQVVAAMSPASESFNWGNVVWHELGHVFAIQLSRNHVPRWFTEGLSEYETIARRPEWQRQLDPQLYTALVNRTLPAAVDMNRAFSHATDGLDVTVAYYASSQLVVFTAETWGMPRVVQALRLWGEGVRTAEVLPKAFGVTPEEYDRRFRQWALGRLSRYQGQFLFDERPKAMEATLAKVKASPGDADAQVDHAFSLLRSKKPQEAEAALTEALRLAPTHKRALFLAGKLAQSRGEGEAARKRFAALQAAGGDGYTLQMALAELAEGAKDATALRRALTAAHGFDPTQPEPLKGLYDLAKREKREGDALDVLRRLAPVDQHDRKVWRLYLQALVDAKAWEEARQVGESALFVDVLGAGTHDLYAQALAAGGDHGRAAFEWESALLCDPKAKDAAAIHGRLAASLDALGRSADAKIHRDAAGTAKGP